MDSVTQLARKGASLLLPGLTHNLRGPGDPERPSGPNPEQAQVIYKKDHYIMCSHLFILNVNPPNKLEHV